MKAAQIIAVLTAGMLLLTGCAAPGTSGTDNTLETRVVYHALPLPNLFIELPETFQETSSEFYETYYICDDASIIITEDTETTNTDIKAYSTRALLQYQELAASVTDVNGEQIYAGELAVEMLEFTYRLTADGDPLRAMVGFASDNKSIFIVTCKCSEANYDRFRDDFLSVLQSMRIDRTAVATAAPTAAAGTIPPDAT